MEKVIISIAGSSGADEIELITDGTLTQTDGKFVLEFDETELSGILGTKTRIVMDKSAVSMQRLGNSDTFLYFQMHQPSITSIGNEGNFHALSVYTHHLKFDTNPQGGDLDIRYTMDINGETAENRVWLNYKLLH